MGRWGCHNARSLAIRLIQLGHHGHVWSLRAPADRHSTIPFKAASMAARSMLPIFIRRSTPELSMK